MTSQVCRARVSRITKRVTQLYFKNSLLSKKKCHATSKSILTVSCGPKRQRSVRQVAMMKTERLGSEVCLQGGYSKVSWDGDIIGHQSETTMTSWLSRPPLVRRAFSSSPFPFPSHLPRFHTGMFNEMYHTVGNSSSSCKGVMRYEKFILKPKIQKFRCYKLDRVLSNQRPNTIYKQGACVLTK